jgi:hypothetical protein
MAGRATVFGIAELIRSGRITLKDRLDFSGQAGICLKQPGIKSKKTESEVGYAKEIGRTR